MDRKNIYGVVTGMGRKAFGAHLDIQKLTIPVGLGTPFLTDRDRCLTNNYDFLTIGPGVTPAGEPYTPENEKWTLRVLDNRCP